MEGISRKLFSALAFSLGFLFFASSFSLQAQENSQLDRLQRIRTLILEALERVENGQSPCYDESCQGRKYELLAQANRKLAWLPDWNNTHFREEAFRSAYILVENPFDLDMTPDSYEDWIQWFRRRYSHEINYRSTWSLFLKEMGAYEDSLSYYRKQAELPQTFKIQIQEAWSTGLADVAVELRHAIALTREASYLDYQLREEEARQKRNQAEAYYERVHEYEDQQGRNLTSILRNLFPDLQAHERLDFLIHMRSLTHWYRTNSFFLPAFEDFVEDHREKFRDILRVLQEFTDLEYGVVGLNNFESLDNPLIRVEEEILIQNEIDLYEGIGRQVVDTGFYFFLMGSGNALGAGSRLLGFSILAPTLYLKEKYNLRLDEWILPVTSHSTDLNHYRMTLEQQMLQRYESLEQTKAALLQRLARVESQIELINQRSNQ